MEQVTTFKKNDMETAVFTSQYDLFEIQIASALEQTMRELYNVEMTIDPTTIQRTRKDIAGDFTIVVFPFVKIARKAPAAVAAEIGETLQHKLNCSINIVGGFLNITFFPQLWLNFLHNNINTNTFGFRPVADEAPILIEFSSPNTNKPLHLGHVRNNLLGSAVSNILKACGKNVIKVNLVNDRGIHICKSMLAWLKWGNGETPETSGLKGDHLIGKYYVEFDKHYKEEVKELITKGLSEEEAAKNAPLLLEAQDMLRRWENGDAETVSLWKKMNGWVYDGFEKTYKRLGIEFDKTYYESETYLLGKSLVNEGLEKNVFYKKNDNSVWVDLTAEGLDEKLLLRKDGTSVYMTQDLGTAQLRYDEFHPQQMIYVVGNEQNYHFDVLKLVLGKKLGRAYGEKIMHLSYGMVELPSGKMKSREGTVVDADDLMAEMKAQAEAGTAQLGKTTDPDEAAALNEMIGMGALKYFILKVDPKKNMLFNPEESIDFNGNTAPFIQYTHARIKSLLRKAADDNINITAPVTGINELSKAEIDIIKSIYEFPQTVLKAGDTLNPSLIANHAFDLSKEFNRFYQETPIFKENDMAKKNVRLQISLLTATVLKNAMGLLGIDVPEKM